MNQVAETEHDNTATAAAPAKRAAPNHLRALEGLEGVDDFRVLRIGAVAFMTGKPRSTVFMEASKGIFPTPIDLGSGTMGWYWKDIREWLLNRPRVDYSRHKVNQSNTPADPATAPVKRGRGRPRKAGAAP